MEPASNVLAERVNVMLVLDVVRPDAPPDPSGENVDTAGIKLVLLDQKIPDARSICPPPVQKSVTRPCPGYETKRPFNLSSEVDVPAVETPSNTNCNCLYGVSVSPESVTDDPLVVAIVPR